MGRSARKVLGAARTAGRHWVRRYLLLDLAGWIGGMGAACAAHATLGRADATAAAALLGENAAFYGMALCRARRAAGVDGGADLVRAMVLEFAPAEALDLLVVRPAALLGATRLCASPLVGVAAGTAVADLAYYAVAGLSARVAARRTHRAATRSRRALS